MKTLKIEKPEQFELPYESLINRQRGYTIQQSRMVGKMLDAFEAAGKVKEVVAGRELFTAKTLPCTIEIEDAPFQLLQEVFEETAWTGGGARRAIAISDWLGEIAKGG
jgi:hypothetical protein